ncbi:hypothetical protein EHV15_11905 [Paenibacillus oralis]|uniref:Uncharacterized protein n=1 Tax=Paenibacillus oralis TaxID=2490856 RepID=A0A3P3U1R6_9BACL|nr:hypothetical protein [Paenibacillus oralis]RRJ63548.1 hypothetical protein EHV15_11905 [Paenibacillus oralis]
MNILTPGVISGLIGASNYMHASNAPMAVYNKEAAKINPDTEKMGRALGVAGNALNSARSESDNAAEELEKAKEQATKTEQAEQEAKLQKDMEAKIKAQREVANQPADTVEISNEARLVSGNNDPASVQQNTGSDTIEPKIYTSDGTAFTVSADINISPVISVRV